jgi:shikimate kinase
MRIYLIGYMGCGKSTLGHQLADILGLTFIDLDKFIEERNYKTVPQLFTEFGEDGFRMRERKALEEVSEFMDVVVATGGGAPCFFDNMELMDRTGITVFLDIETSILTERLFNSKTERPLIHGKMKHELSAFIDSMMLKRRPFYEKAEIHINTHLDILDSVLNEIRKKIKKTEKKP